MATPSNSGAFNPTWQDQVDAVWGKILSQADVYQQPPHDFMNSSLNLLGVLAQDIRNPNLVKGKVFEWLIHEVLIAKGVGPFYYDASLPEIPNTRFDFFMYHPYGPLVLSAMYSLRERWKVTALGARLLQDVYPDQETYLVVGPGTNWMGADGDRVRNIIRNPTRRVQFGLAGCISATSPEFSDLIDYLSSRFFSEAESISARRMYDHYRLRLEETS